jgi:hypothetical protein
MALPRSSKAAQQTNQDLSLNDLHNQAIVLCNPEPAGGMSHLAPFPPLPAIGWHRQLHILCACETHHQSSAQQQQEHKCPAPWSTAIKSIMLSMVPQPLQRGLQCTGTHTSKAQVHKGANRSSGRFQCRFNTASLA